MDTGKVSESILKRSILKYVGQNKNALEGSTHFQMEKGAEVGLDYALFSQLNQEKMVSATSVWVERDRLAIVRAINNVRNNLACAGAHTAGVSISITLSTDIYESELRHMMEEAKDYAIKHNILLMGGHTSVSNNVLKPVISITGFGSIHSLVNDVKYKEVKLEENIALVVTKTIGLLGTSMIAKYKGEDLEKRLPPRMISEAEGFSEQMSIVEEAKIAIAHGCHAMHDISGGGIFRAIWELLERAKIGCNISLKQIPLRQETVEICEFYGLNPYELLSTGALLIATKDGEELVDKLEKAGIEASIIGVTVRGNDKAIISRASDGEEVRYLDKPKSDEIDKIL